jgi:hypothetical protein
VRQRFAACAALLGLASCDAVSPPEPAVTPPAEPPAAETTASVEPPAVRPPDPAELAAAQAIAEAMREPDPWARVRRLAALLPTLGPEGVHGVKEILRSPTLTPSGTEIDLLVRFWATHEPAQATRWVATECPSGYRFSAMLSSLPLWAAADPQAALGPVGELESDQTLREAVQIGLVRGWFEKDRAELLRHIQGLELGFGRQRALTTYIRLLLQKEGAEALLRWAESVPDDDRAWKKDVYRQVAVGLPPFDVDAALRWCEVQCEGPNGEGLRGIIAMRWAQLGGGEAALEWLSSAPESAERNDTLPLIFGEWARLAPTEVSAWMAARSADAAPPPWLPLLYSTYALSRMLDAPAEAIRWAQRIEDEAIRERMLIRIARSWRWQDEAAAEAWLAESPLSEKARENARLTPSLQDRAAK